MFKPKAITLYILSKCKNYELSAVGDLPKELGKHPLFSLRVRRDAIAYRNHSILGKPLQLVLT